MARKRKALPRGLWLRGDVYYARIAGADGKLIRKRLSADKTTAIILLNNIRKNVELQRAGIIAPEVHCRIHDLRELEKRYIAHLRGTVSEATIENFITGWAQVIYKNRFSVVSDVTLPKVEAWAQEKRREISGQTLNLYIGHVARAFEWAARNEMILRNPLINRKPLRTSESRKRRDFLPDEVVRFLATEQDPEWHLRWLVYFYTGLRCTAGMLLQWEWLDLDKEILHIPKEASKSHRPFDVPVHPVLLRRLVDLKAKVGDNPSGAVFSSVSYKTLLKRFNALCIKAGLDREGLVPHSIRHTYATALYEGTGRDIKVVQVLLDHASPGTTLRYLHLTPEERARAIETIKYGCEDP